MHLHTPRLLQDPIILRIENLLKPCNADGWIVGPYVRNRLLGRPAPTLTILTTAEPRRTGMELVRRLGRATTVTESRSYDVTIDVSDSVDTTIQRIRFAQLQSDSIYSYVAQRGFTIDTLAVDIRNSEFIDPVGGYTDLVRGHIRAVDSASLRENPIRMLRAVRLAATLQFSITLDTLMSMQQHAAHISNAPPYVIFEEFMRLLSTPATATYLSVMDDVGLLRHFLPELTECRNVAQPVQHTLDVYGHTLRVVSALEALIPNPDTATSQISDIWTRPLDRHYEALQAYLEEEAAPGYTRREALKLAAVLHDVGKPATYSVDEDGDIHFYGHDEIGAEIAEARLVELGAQADLTEWVTTVIRHHSWPLQILKSEPCDDQFDPHRVFAAHPNLVAAIALHSAADQLGKGHVHLPAGMRKVLHYIWDAAFNSMQRCSLHASAPPYHSYMVAVGA